MAEPTDLIQEALKNLREDREKVKAVRDLLVNSVVGSEESEQPLVIDAEISENIARLSDVLTKMNIQIVDLAKASLKSSVPDDQTLDPKSIFDEIESELVEDKLS